MSKKLPPVPLSATDIADFVASQADFGFEMAVLRELRSRGFDCHHAASYEDPVTGKLRAFDIRARRTGPCAELCLTVECKHLSAQAPLLVHSTPRLDTESFHSVIAKHARGGDQWPFTTTMSPSDTYPSGDSVGRQTDQPSRNGQGAWVSADAGTYDKWIQAVNGARDFAQRVSSSGLRSGFALAVLPMLVVPTGTLWQADYDAGGNSVGPPRGVGSSQLFIGYTWPLNGFITPLSLSVSHLEICTLDGLGDRLQYLDGVNGPLARASEIVRA